MDSINKRRYLFSLLDSFWENFKYIFTADAFTFTVIYISHSQYRVSVA